MGYAIVENTWLNSFWLLEELYVLKLDLQGFAYLEFHGYPWCLEVHSVHVNQEVKRTLRRGNIRNGSLLRHYSIPQYPRED